MEKLTEKEAYEMYDECLDEEGPIRIGSLSYDPSDVLKNVDPTAYECGFTDYIDSLIRDGYIIEGFNDED